jgi:hypothetical protein
MMKGSELLDLYSRAESMAVADGFVVRGKNAQLVQDTARAAWNMFTHTITSQDMKMKTIGGRLDHPLTDKLAYTT